MAPALGLVRQLFLRPGSRSHALTRSMFVARKRDTRNPNWFRVGLAFAFSAALWALLLKQHNANIAEYERRKEEREKHNEDEKYAL